MAKSRTVWFGWVTFAAVMLTMLGLLNVFEGLVALLQKRVAFVDGNSLVVINLTGWGVATLVFGALLIAAGIGLLARNTVARIAAIIIVMLHALAQIGSLGAYPVWSLLMITFDVIVLFALTVHWSAAMPEPETMPTGIHRADPQRMDTQPRDSGFPTNQPSTHQPPTHQPPAHQPPSAQPVSRQAPVHQGASQQPTGQQQPEPAPGNPQAGYQAYNVHPMGDYPSGAPNSGPYPSGRPNSPAHAAPTSGYDSGAI